MGVDIQVDVRLVRSVVEGVREELELLLPSGSTVGLQLEQEFEWLPPVVVVRLSRWTCRLLRWHTVALIRRKWLRLRGNVHVSLIYPPLYYSDRCVAVLIVHPDRVETYSARWSWRVYRYAEPDCFDRLYDDILRAF